MALKHLQKITINHTKEKRINKHINSAFILFLIMWVIFYGFIEPKLIGRDIRYTIMVVCLPIVIGLIALIIYRYKFLLFTYQKTKGFWTKMVTGIFYLVFGLMFSFVSLGLFANILWGWLNKMEADKSPTELVVCPVSKFVSRKKRDYVDFQFKGRSEQIITKKAGEFASENPKNYQIELTLQKGIWNHYLVKNWQLVDIRQ
jgi:hypothetical protein